jgi:thioredoxin
VATAVWNGAVIAQSDDVVVVDGYHYFPMSALDPRYVVPSTHTSRCYWKGTASYFSIVVDGKENRDAAWYYPSPSEAAAVVTDRVGFWRGVKVVSGAEPDDPGASTTRPGLLERLRGRPGRSGRSARGQVAAGEVSHVEDIDDDSFLAATADGWTLVDFSAPWCGPCRSFQPVFERAARDHAGHGVRFGRLDVDRSPRAAATVGIQSVPTLVLFDPDGNEVRRIVGMPSAASLDELIHHST